MSGSDLEFWCKDLKAKLDFIKDAGFEPEMPNGLRFPPTRYDLIDDRTKYEDLAYSVSDYVEKNYQFAESIIVYKDIINNIFINKSIDISESGKLIVSMNNGTALPLNKLSSGETQILLMFYYILFHSGQDGIVIIDEPEISLHVSWQQMLGDYFNDICRVRKVQIIVATHSPQIIHDKWDLAIELVRKNA
jgi:predicted ATP-dependent endonuclease of OLD family